MGTKGELEKIELTPRANAVASVISEVAVARCALSWGQPGAAGFAWQLSRAFFSAVESAVNCESMAAFWAAAVVLPKAAGLNPRFPSIPRVLTLSDTEALVRTYGTWIPIEKCFVIPASKTKGKAVI